MLDLGWTELLVVGVVALIVIGPRDLPAALHTFGKYVGKLRGMARDFQHGIDEIARQQELQDIQKSVRDIGSPRRAIENYIDGVGDPDGDSVKPAAAPENKALADSPAPAPAPAEGDAKPLDEAPAGDAPSDNASAESSPAKPDTVRPS